MFIFNMITSLVNIGAGSSWTIYPIINIFMMIDGLIYTLLSYSFNVFLLMCNLNFNTIYGIVSGLIDRLKAVIMVLVLFKVGVALIGYMLNPDQAAQGSKDMVKNIIIVSVLLVSYQFVFNVLNELGMMIMGNPTGYPYTTLSSIANVSNEPDEGLILRFVFGDGKTKIGDIGDYLAYSTLSMFVYDYDNQESSTILKKEICDSDKCDFEKLHNLSSKVNKTIEYKWGLTAVVGLFLVYSIFKSAIEIGIRMFKLLILQLIAPIAIITIIQDGVKNNTHWKKYTSTYIKVFLDAFIRMLIMLITIVFVCKFFLNISDFFGNLSTAEGKPTKFLIQILVIIAAFKIGDSIPKFIGDIFEFDVGGSTTNLVGSLLGAGTGLVAGAVGGFVGGGVGGALSGAAKGTIQGAQAGSKGNNVSEFFKGQKAVGESQAKHAAEVAAAGGGLAYMGDKFSNSYKSLSDGRKARENAAIDKDIKRLNDEQIKPIDKEMQGITDENARIAAIEAAIEAEAKGTKFAYSGAGGAMVDWDRTDEEIAAMDSVFKNTSIQEEAFRRKIEQKSATGGYANDAEREADIRRLRSMHDQTELAHKAALDKVKTDRDAYRDTLTAASGTTVAERKVQKIDNENRSRELSETKRQLEIRKRELEGSKQELTKKK